MAGFSITEAYGAGLRIIRRRPLVPLVWGLAYFVVGVLPLLLVMSSVMPGFIEMVRHAPPPGTQADPQQVQQAMASMSGLFLMQPVQLICGVAASAIISAAVFRAVFEPEQSRGFYLRLGMQEVWQGLVLLCIYVMLFVAYLALFIPMLIVFAAAAAGAVAAAGGGASGGGGSMLILAPIMIAVGLASVGALMWLALRFSMALPMTFADRQFRLFESWNLTRGRVTALFGLCMLQVVTVLVVEIVLFILALLIGGVVFANAGGAGRLDGLFSQQPSVWLPKIMPVAVVLMALGAAVSGYFLAFVYAPWADVYRQLRSTLTVDHFGPAPSNAPLG